MTVYLCKESLEGILCGVYDAWMSRLGHGNVRLALADSGNLELFCEYREVQITGEKVEKVLNAVKTKISEDACELVCKVACSQDEDRADKIYRFLIYGFYYGEKILNMLQIPVVSEVSKLRLSFEHETHQLTGFVRFSQIHGNLLVSRIGPKNDVLMYLAPHFADRLSGENWMLCDEKRRKAALHPAGKQWFLAAPGREEWERLTDCKEEGDMFVGLWKIFRTCISIEERENPVCQRGNMPLRYRPYMTEFQDGIREGRQRRVVS